MASAVLADAVSISGTPCGDVKFAGGGGPAVLLTMDPAQSKLKLLKSLEAPAAKLTAVPPVDPVMSRYRGVPVEYPVPPTVTLRRARSICAVSVPGAANIVKPLMVATTGSLLPETSIVPPPVGAL